nr:hypothetical protein [Providencia sp. PROV075]
MLFASHLTGQNKHEEAFGWLQKSAQQEDFIGLFYLGVAYAHGLGTKQNDELAKVEFMKACKAGYPLSCDEYDKLKKLTLPVQR